MRLMAVNGKGACYYVNECVFCITNEMKLIQCSLLLSAGKPDNT